MQNTIRFCFAALALSAAVGAQAARPLEFTVGTEYYNETYREYEGSERMMQPETCGLSPAASNTALTTAMQQK